MKFETNDRERPVHFTDLPGPWEALSCAIIKTACDDYKVSKGKGRREIEEFIRSEYFKKISNINPDWLIKNLREKFKPDIGAIKG